MRKLREKPVGTLRITVSTSGIQRAWAGVSIVGEENLQFIRELAQAEYRLETSILSQLINNHIRNLREFKTDQGA